MSSNPQAQNPNDKRMGQLQGRMDNIQTRIDRNPDTPNKGMTNRLGRLQGRYDDLSSQQPPVDGSGYLGPPIRAGGFPGVVNRQGGGIGTTIQKPTNGQVGGVK